MASEVSLATGLHSLQSPLASRAYIALDLLHHEISPISSSWMPDQECALEPSGCAVKHSTWLGMLMDPETLQCHALGVANHPIIPQPKGLSIGPKCISRGLSVYYPYFTCSIWQNRSCHGECQVDWIQLVSSFGVWHVSYPFLCGIMSPDAGRLDFFQSFQSAITFDQEADSCFEKK